MTQQAPPVSLACPRCGVGLSIAQAASAVLHGCSGCGGIWLDMVTSHRFCQALDGDAHALVEAASKHAAYAVDLQSPVACPVCQTVLLRTRLEHAQVDIDYCGHHGSWFDKGELVRIAQAAAVQRAYGSRASAPVAQTAAPQSSQGGSWDAEDTIETAGFGLEVLIGLAEVFSD